MSTLSTPAGLTGVAAVADEHFLSCELFRGVGVVWVVAFGFAAEAFAACLPLAFTGCCGWTLRDIRISNAFFSGCGLAP